MKLCLRDRLEDLSDRLGLLIEFWIERHWGARPSSVICSCKFCEIRDDHMIFQLDLGDS